MRINAMRFPVTSILFALALFGCGGGGGGGGGNPGQAEAVFNLSGNWNYSNDGVVTYSEDGVTYPPEYSSGTGTISIQQTGTNTSWRDPILDEPRTGTIKGTHVSLSGRYVVPLVGNVVVNQNAYSTSGTYCISYSGADKTEWIEMEGTGNASGTYQGISWSVAGSDDLLLTREGTVSPPPTIRVEGFKYFFLLDQHDGVKRYRATVRVKNTTGNALTDGSLVNGMNVYGHTGAELPLDGSFYLWNGSGLSTDNGAGIVSSPVSDIEVYLAAAPGTLSGGFYTVIVTDSNGNHFASEMYFQTPVQVGKPAGLSQTINADDSITLSWTNPAGISAPAYSVAVYVVFDDGNGDGLQDNPLIAYLPTISNSYTIPAGFVRSALIGKTGLKWMVEIRQQTTGPVDVPCGPPYTAQFYRTRSAQAILTPPDLSPVFTQADVTGTWDVLNFKTGTSAGWSRNVSTFDASGNMAETNYRDSEGGTPGASRTLSVNAAGEVSVTQGGVPTGFHGQMSSDKKLMVGIEGLDDNGTSVLFVARKRTGTTFTSADLENISSVSYGLFSGTDNTWEWAIGTTDAAGNVTLGSRTNPSGTSGPFPNVATVSVNSDGIVTNTLDPSWYGFMTDDKKVFFSINTADAGKYYFMVGMVTGQTYTQADLAGVSYFNALNSATLVKPGWAYGSASMDNAGAGTYLTYTDSAGAAMPGPYTRVLSSTGVYTDPTNPSLHGQLSHNKNITVRTGTSATSGRHQIVIGIK